jgi:hypothetical protein
MGARFAVSRQHTRIWVVIPESVSLAGPATRVLILNNQREGCLRRYLRSRAQYVVPRSEAAGLALSEFTALPSEWLVSLGDAAPPVRPLIGAPVASPRGRSLRPG